jgi:hypothetical protein
MTAPPAPLEWHPAYRDQTWLLDWLEGRREGRTDIIKFPILPPMRIRDYDRAPDPVETPPTRTLTKRKAYGHAPYVGRPFVYRWWCAVDELGRGIAGESRIAHVEPDFTFCSGPFDYAPDARNGHDPDTPVWP